MIENNQYFQDVKVIGDSEADWQVLRNSRVLLTGASGLIGSFLVDVLMYRNRLYGDNITVYAVGRDEEKARQRFAAYQKESRFVFLKQDITSPLRGEIIYDYIIHGASNTHPRAYAQDPVGTITTNILGLSNLLEYAVSHPAKRIFLMSSVEIYGENTGGKEMYAEEDLGYIDCNTLRAGYPESKRVSESLCQAYISKYGMDIVIGRFSRVYGPTMNLQDSKALAQFINRSVNHEDIILKSDGRQYYSYSYVADAVSALLTILTVGEKGAAYNVADLKSNVTLKELAEILAGMAGTKVVYELPDQVERVGYSTATRAILDPGRLWGAGWRARFSIEEGLWHTVNILKEERKRN